MIYFVIGGLVTWCLALSFLVVGLAAQRREQELELDLLQDVDERRAREINELYQANAIANNRITDLSGVIDDMDACLIGVITEVMELQDLHEFELDGAAPSSSDGWLN